MYFNQQYGLGVIWMKTHLFTVEEEAKGYRDAVPSTRTADNIGWIYGQQGRFKHIYTKNEEAVKIYGT